MSFLFGNWDLLTHLGSIVRVNVVIGYVWILVKGYQNFSERIYQSRVSPGLINFWIFFVLSDTNSYSIALIIKSSCSQQQFPMKRSSCMIETSRINQYSCSFFSHQHSQFWKPDIIAYSHTHSAVFCIKCTDRFTSSKCLGLVVAYLSWDIDVKKMSFIILCLELTLRIYYKGSIEKVLVEFTRDSSNCVHFMLSTDLFDSVECR